MEDSCVKREDLPLGAERRFSDEADPPERDPPAILILRLFFGYFVLVLRSVKMHSTGDSGATSEGAALGLHARPSLPAAGAGAGAWEVEPVGNEPDRGWAAPGGRAFRTRLPRDL